MDKFLDRLFSNPDMLRMGHGQRGEDRNLGLGWIYYALGRLLRPSHAVCIGSWRGFAPAVMGRALLDNLVPGKLWFIDPSMVDDFWKDPETTQKHFSELGAENVEHFCQTTQSFVQTDAFRKLGRVGLLMIDGWHTAEQARFDYVSFLDKLDERSVVLFHDSVRPRLTTIYGDARHYEHTVYKLITRLKQLPELEVFSFPEAAGLTMVRGIPNNLALINEPF